MLIGARTGAWSGGKRPYWVWPKEVMYPKSRSDINSNNAYVWISLATHQNSVLERPGYITYTESSMTKAIASTYQPCVVVKLERNKSFVIKFKSTNEVGSNFRIARYVEGDSGALTWVNSFGPKCTKVGGFQTYQFDSGDYEWFLLSFYISTVPTTFTEISIEELVAQ